MPSSSHRARSLLPAILAGSLIAVTNVTPISAQWSTIETPEFAAAGDIVPGQFIVMTNNGSPLDIVRSYDIDTGTLYERLGGFAARLTERQVAALQQDKRVAIVEPDRIVTAFPVKPFPMPSRPGTFAFGECFDRIDNDGDGQRDWPRDSDCTSAFDPTEGSPPVSSSSSSSSSSAPSSQPESSSSTPPSSSSSSSSSSDVSSSESSSSSDESSSESSLESSSSSFVASSSSSSPIVIPVPTGINRADAEQNPALQLDGIDQVLDVDIAVIDTGSQANHPDLRVVEQVNFTREWSLDDRNGHGTHVAGTIAALDNGTGVVGMAPGARIWSVKVLDRNGSGYLSDIIEGIDYVTQHADEIEVANMSLGCECQSSAMNAAISRSVDAGVVYVVAAGNSAKNASTFSPANHPDVIAVSAIADFNGLPGGGAPATCRSDADDTFADFSNYGSVVDIAAPGVCIESTWTGGSYRTISGTSMASPHVAGAAALHLLGRPKPQNDAEVLAVKNALVTAGFPQSGPNGFTEDPDAIPEVLLNAAGL